MTTQKGSGAGALAAGLVAIGLLIAVTASKDVESSPLPVLSPADATGQVNLAALSPEDWGEILVHVQTLTAALSSS